MGGVNSYLRTVMLAATGASLVALTAPVTGQEDNQHAAPSGWRSHEIGRAHV